MDTSPSITPKRPLRVTIFLVNYIAITVFGIFVGIRFVSMEHLANEGIGTTQIILGLAAVIVINSAVSFGLYTGKKWTPILLLVLVIIDIFKKIIDSANLPSIFLPLLLLAIILAALFTAPSRKFFFRSKK